jgi:hypothetical protein
MLDRDCPVTTVKIAHLAGTHMRGADGESRTAVLDQVEVHQFFQRLL